MLRSLGKIISFLNCTYYALRLVLIVFSTTFKPFGLGLSLVGVPRLIPQCLPPTHACGGHILPSASIYKIESSASSSGLNATKFSITFPIVVDLPAVIEPTPGFPAFKGTRLSLPSFLIFQISIFLLFFVFFLMCRLRKMEFFRNTCSGTTVQYFNCSLSAAKTAR